MNKETVFLLLVILCAAILTASLYALVKLLPMLQYILTGIQCKDCML